MRPTVEQEIALSRMLAAIATLAGTLKDTGMAIRVVTLQLRMAGFSDAEVKDFLAPLRAA